MIFVHEMKRSIRLLRTITLLGALASLFFLYADAPQMVVIYKQGDFVYRISRSMLFYVMLGTIVVPHFLVGYTASFMKSLKLKEGTVNWFGALSIVVNIFLATSLIFIDILNSLENFDYNYFGYLTVVALLLVVLWVGGMVSSLIKKG